MSAMASCQPRTMSGHHPKGLLVKDLTIRLNLGLGLLSVDAKARDYHRRWEIRAEAVEILSELLPKIGLAHSYQNANRSLL